MSGTRFTDVRRFDSVDSTNRYLLDEARAGAAEGVVAVADYQTAGRGRFGRRWEAPAGANLLVSMLLRPVLAPAERYLAPATVALAAADAARQVAEVTLVVKWPNDLLGPDGRKIAGVLAEADAPGPAGPTAPPPIVVGIGVNVNWPSSGDDLPADLAAAGSLRRLTGRPVDRDELLAALLTALEPRVEALASREGRVAQVDALRARCATLGTDVRVELADETFEGRAVDLTPEGHLVVERGGARRAVPAGDVVHLRPDERPAAAPESASGPGPGPR